MTSGIKLSQEERGEIENNNSNHHPTTVCYIPDSRYVSGDIASTARSNLNLNKSVGSFFSPWANTDSLNRQGWHTEKLFSVHIVSPTHVLFGEFETWKKRDLFIVILTLLISLHALWG